MRLGHRLDHVGDQFAGRQGVVHPLVPHGHAVADAGDAEEEGIAAAGVDTLLDEALQVAHAHMTGDQVGKAGGHADKRLVHLALRNAGPFEQGAVRGPLQPFLDHITAHV